MRYVRRGKAALGLTPARAMDELGVHSFDALGAPFVIDSMALQQAVLASGLVGPMLAGTRAAGVTGLGLLPGPLRHPVGISHPMLAAVDYRGADIGISGSDLTVRSLTALGAAGIVPLAGGQPIDGLDGAEMQVAAVASRQYDSVAGSLTADVVLWPRPLVVFANPAALAAAHWMHVALAA